MKLKSLRNQWQLQAFLIIPLVILILFHYVPMFGIVAAFEDYSPALGYLKSPWVGLKHFEAFFNNYQFWRIIGNTLRISAYSIFLGFPLPIFFALMLNTVRQMRFKKFLQTLTYVPHFISTVVIVGILMQILNPVYGAYGAIYRLLGNSGYPANLLSNPNNFVNLYFLSGVWQNLGWDAILYIAALSSIGPELHEAAELDGASRFQRIIHVDFPGILPTAIILLIISTGSVMSVGFEKVYLMQNSMNIVKSEVISTYVYKTGIASATANLSAGTAVDLFNSVVNCSMLIFVNFISRKISGESLW